MPAFTYVLAAFLVAALRFAAAFMLLRTPGTAARVLEFLMLTEAARIWSFVMAGFAAFWFVTNFDAAPLGSMKRALAEDFRFPKNPPPLCFRVFLRESDRDFLFFLVGAIFVSTLCSEFSIIDSETLVPLLHGLEELLQDELELCQKGFLLESLPLV
jgi:hypothetical protein